MSLMKFVALSKIISKMTRFLLKHPNQMKHLTQNISLIKSSLPKIIRHP